MIFKKQVRTYQVSTQNLARVDVVQRHMLWGQKGFRSEQEATSSKRPNDLPPLEPRYATVGVLMASKTVQNKSQKLSARFCSSDSKTTGVGIITIIQ